MVHYDEPHLTVSWDGELEAVVMEWQDFASGEPYREGLNAGLELVEQRGARNWLADLREMGTVTEEDKQWSNEEWFPRALESPLEHMAIVQPESVIANMAVEDIMEEVGGGALTTHHFDNRPEAEDWLEERGLVV